jgi:hypothetical protein
MRPECETAIKTAAQRELSKAELESIEERINGALRELSVKDEISFLSMSKEQRLVEAAKLAKERMLKDVVRAHEQSIQEAARKNDLFKRVRMTKPGDVGQTSYLANRIMAVENTTRAIAANFLRQFEGFREADAGMFFGLLQDPESQFQIVKSLYGEPSSPEANRFANSTKKVMDALAERFERAGLTLNKREDYRTPQPQDPGKVASVKRDEWVEDHLGWIDRRQYVKSDGSRMSEDEIRDMLNESYRNIAMDGANKRAEAESATVIKSMIIGANKNAPRRLFFKNAASWSAAMNKYGVTNNLYQLIQSHVHSMSKDIAMAEEFGRNADANFNQALAIAKVEDLEAGADGNKLNALSARTAHMFDAYVHPLRPENAKMANTMGNIRGYISAVLLGGSWISSLPDLPAMMLTAKVNSLPSSRLFKNFVMAMTPGPEKNDFLHRLGVWFEGFQSAHNRLAEEQFSFGWGQFLADTQYKLMMQNSYDRGTRAGHAATSMQVIGQFSRAHEKLKNADGEPRFLENMGVTQEIWDVWRATDLETGPRGFTELLAPGKIYEIPDAKIDAIVEKRVKARNENLKAEIERRNAQTEKEKQWYKNRIENFDAARDRANRMLREFDQRRKQYIGEAAQMAEMNAELLRAKMERAEVEHDIAGYLKTETAQDRIKRFLERVEDGENVERQLVKERDYPDRLPDAVVERYQKTPSIGERAVKGVEDYGRSINRIAENLGARRARTEARIKAAQKRIDEMSKQYDAEVQRKANAVDKRFAAALKEIQEMAERYKERAAKRKEYADAFQSKIGKVLGEERIRIKDEAAEKLLEVVYAAAQRAARGASGATIDDRVAFGFTRFPSGTFWGEMLRFGMQFKSVPLGVFRAQIDTIQSIPTIGSKAAYALKFLAYTTLAGAVGLQIKALLNGQDLTNVDFSTEEGRAFWIKAMAAGGGVGFYGDLLANTQNPYGRDGLAALVGPGPGIVNEAGKLLLSEIPTKLAEDKPEEAALKSVQFIRRNAIPLMNTWYLKGAFNRLIYDQIQEALVPGTVERHRKRMESKGASYWWEPGETGPTRAPDLSKAYEE